jgi:serine protease Do
MMGRGNWLLDGVMLFTGLVVGLLIDEGLTRSAQARNVTADEAVRLSQDLQQPGLSLASGNAELAKVARLMRASVVHIESKRQSARGGSVEETGSGVLMALPPAEGMYVVTNRHVVTGSPQLAGITVQLDNGQFLHPTQVWQDKATDVAVLKLPQVSAVPARWGDSDGLEIGHIVLALGSPFGLSQTVTLGIVSAKGRRSLALGATGEMLNQDFIQTDAAINPGNSGGPLVDLHGRVVGINTAIASNSGGNEGIAFSIPSNLVRRVAESLVKHGKVPRAYLGVKLDPEFTAETARKFNLERLRGARVLQVYEKTPAARAALQLDDIILEFNGIEVQDENHLINMVSLTPIGKTVRLNVLRGGRVISVDVLLADRTELDGQSAAPPAELPGDRVVPTSFSRESAGLRLHPLDASLVRQIGLGDQAAGLVVLEAPAGSGFAPYDVLIEAGRIPLRSVADWDASVASAGEGGLLVKVVRVDHGARREFLAVWPGRSASPSDYQLLWRTFRPLRAVPAGVDEALDAEDQKDGANYGHRGKCRTAEGAAFAQSEHHRESAACGEQAEQADRGGGMHRVLACPRLGDGQAARQGDQETHGGRNQGRLGALGFGEGVPCHADADQEQPGNDADQGHRHNCSP